MDMPINLPPVALAKIQPPQSRGSLVERPELEAALGGSLQHHRLTLLLAPAGYGKTAALTRQLQQLPEGWALAWVSADADDPLPRFLACLSAALQPLDLPWRVAPDALPMLAQASRGLGDVAGELSNALAGAQCERGLLIVDDAHRIVDRQVFALLDRLLERGPERWGLVIASRVEPPLALARLRGAGELGEFRQRQLRFSPADAGRLCAASGQQAEEEQVRELLRRTHGWAAGLRLSLSARRAQAAQRGDALARRHLFDYLAAEVLDDMPEALRDFLLRCSVLPELSARRCAELTGDQRAARWLEELERRSLFVSVLDADEPTLRLHDLFREFLEDRLRRDRPEELPQLLQRAAAQESDLSRAVRLLARAGAWEAAGAVLARQGAAWMLAAGPAAVEQLLALFPAHELERQADLHMLRGLTAFSRYDWDSLLQTMQLAAAGYERDGRARDAAVAMAYVCAGLHHCGRQSEATERLERLRALPLDDAARPAILYVSAWNAYACEDSGEVVRCVAAMLDCLERLSDLRQWHPFANLSLFAGLPGMAAQLQRFVDDVMRGGGLEPSALRAAVWHVRCSLALSAGELDEAMQWLSRADEDCRWLGQPRLLTTDNALAHVLLHAVRGEAEASMAAGRLALDDVRQHSAVSHRQVHEAEVLIAMVRASWVLEDEGALRQFDRELQAAANPAEWRGSPRMRAWSQAFVALLDARLDDAVRLLDPIARDIERHRYFACAQVRLLLADAQLRLGALDAAALTLRDWCRMSARDGKIGGALFAGAAVLRRLATADWTGRLAADELTQLLSLPGRLRPRAQSPEGAGLASLSQRERDVLARLAAGDSNKLIARAFALSPHTVKRHVANILDKLGVATRGQAADRHRRGV